MTNESTTSRPHLEIGYGLKTAYTDLRGAEATLALARYAVGWVEGLSEDSRPISTHEISGALEGARAQVERAMNLIIELIDAADMAHRSPPGSPAA